jgi:hypothetical protein
MMMITLLTVVLNVASAVVLQLRLAHIAQSCALIGARSLSQSAFYQSGVFAVNPDAAATHVVACVPQFSWPTTQGVISANTQTSGASVTVKLTAQFTPPLSLPFLSTALHMTLSAQSQAQEFTDTTP